MPTIEVRFEHLDVEAEVRVGSSGVPTVLNSITNTLEEAATALRLVRSRKRKMPVLQRRQRRHQALQDDFAARPARVR